MYMCTLQSQREDWRVTRMFSGDPTKRFSVNLRHSHVPVLDEIEIITSDIRSIFSTDKTLRAFIVKQLRLTSEAMRYQESQWVERKSACLWPGSGILYPILHDLYTFVYTSRSHKITIIFVFVAPSMVRTYELDPVGLCGGFMYQTKCKKPHINRMKHLTGNLFQKRGAFAGVFFWQKKEENSIVRLRKLMSVAQNYPLRVYSRTPTVPTIKHRTVCKHRTLSHNCIGAMP